MLSLFKTTKKEDLAVTYRISIKSSFITQFKVWFNNHSNNTPRIIEVFGNLFIYETTRTVGVLDKNKFRFKLYISNPNMLSGQKVTIEIFTDDQFVSRQVVLLDEKKANSGWILYEVAQWLKHIEN